MKKRVLIINTGGTISSVKTERGYEPQSKYVEKALAKVPAMQHQEMPLYDIKEYQPLIDSSNMTIEDWNHIAKDIEMHMNDYDAFLVLHGTDTMAYTASALSFMLENLQKPVILTGSQIPLSEVRNDAMDNLVTSLWIGATKPIHEVCIYFNQRLLRGNRSKKISAQRLDSFASPNCPPLALIAVDITLDKRMQRSKPTEPFRVQTLTPQRISNVRLFPGLSPDVLTHLLTQPIKALILETYGTGNAPNLDPEFLYALKEANDRGIILVNCSQCVDARVEMGQYATGYALKEVGLLNAKDMTAEALHCKLLYLLSKYSDLGEIKRLVEKNLCGELNE